jgi:hypothetical protein
MGVPARHLRVERSIDVEYDFMKRGYLLPTGCKDLIDVLNLKAMQQSSPNPGELISFLKLNPKLTPQQLAFMLGVLKKLKPQFLKFEPAPPASQASAPLPPILREVVVPAETTVSQLAALLGQKLSQVVADVMELGFFVTTKDALSFEIISSVARKHGFFAIRVAS